MKNSKLFRVLCLAAVLCLLPVCFTAAEDKPDPIPVIDEADITPTPRGVHHYMLICLDQWGFKFSAYDSHTDGLMLVTVDEYTGRVILTSFIRDMLIQRFDSKFGRINNIFMYYQTDVLDKKERGTESGSRKAIEELVRTINTHFDLDIEKYIVVDFSQVQAIIDAIGGVDVHIQKREATRMRSFGLDIPGEGIYHLKGYEAVIYMRIRKTAFEYTDENGVYHKETQDEGRTRRARIVLSAIADQMSDIDEDQAWNVVDTVMEHTILTNMTNSDLLDIVRMALELKGTPIEQIRMPIDGSSEEMPVAGMATVQLDWEKNREALHEFLFELDFTVR